MTDLDTKKKEEAKQGSGGDMIDLEE